MRTITPGIQVEEKPNERVINERVIKEKLEKVKVIKEKLEKVREVDGKHLKNLANINFTNLEDFLEENNHKGY